MKDPTSTASRRRFFRLLFSPFCFLLALTLFPASLAVSASDVPGVSVIFFDAKDRELCRFEAEPAITPQQQAQGLMFRTSLRRRTGMLFVHDRDEIQNYWMKNTWIPLDIIFINGRYEVVHVHRGARPHDETDISSRHPVRYILEVNAGEAKECAITRGVRVRFGSTSTGR
ncbi:MAG: hypothetical protein A4E61_01475 [Syntrophorhabdus sp. PtaB.Bin184]|jgi:uncharacterized membrane protein (UPF0127 family)|nr:MAG: hypothetical protein A4E61_01475 [Syntrophorhabdus sp. PtaB.Bin184]